VSELWAAPTAPCGMCPSDPAHELRFEAQRRYSPQIRFDVEWSSPVARQAHNLEVRGSNPRSATITGSAMLDPRLIAYANLCHAVMTAGLVLWLDLVGEALTGTR
jgi:hypothetical protein